MGMWAARTSWATRTTCRSLQRNGRVTFCLGTVILYATTLAVVLVFGGVEKNPGPGVKVEQILQVLCSECDRNVESGTQFNTCGGWFHDSCGNVKTQVAESTKWICGMCRLERLRLLEEKLQNALLEIDNLTWKNRELEEEL